MRTYTIRSQPKRPKKTEFSKSWLVLCAVTTVLFCTLSYVLSFLGKDTVQELSIAIVNAMFLVDGGSFIAYAVQNCVRAYSEDKYLNNGENK